MVESASQPLDAPRRRIFARRPALASGIAGGALSRAAILLIGLAAVFGVSVASILIGSAGISFDEAWNAIFHYDDANALTGQAADHATFIRELRGPRTLVGLGVGAGLGMAGALIQGLTRNPLADPWILGLEAGASFAVVVAIFAFSITNPTGYAGFALVGAAVAWLIVFAVGAGSGTKATPINITLAGAAIAALFTSLTTAVIVVDAATLDEYRYWAVGSLVDRDISLLVDLLPFLGAGLVIALFSGRALNGLSLGDDVARSQGQNVALTQAVLAIAIVLLAGAAVALAGPVGFIGLVVPHLARAIVGPDYRWIVPYSAVFGAILILVADIVGRVIMPPGEVQVGIIMALIGAPIFVAFVRRRKLVDI